MTRAWAPNLSFEILSANPAREVMEPALLFEIRVSNAIPEQQIHAVLLRCQLRIDVARRRYSAEEQAQLLELFSTPDRWSDTLRPITWLNASVNVQAFQGAATFHLPAPCTWDFTAAAAKYFYGIEAGEVPVSILFSGSVFFAAQEGEALQACPISWDKEARFRLSANIWRRVMELYYPNSACLRLRREVFDQLYRYKLATGVISFDEAIERMLALAEAQGRAS